MLEPFEPFVDDFQSAGIHRVDAGTASFLLSEQTRALENAKVATHGRPGALEPTRDLSGRHGPTAKTNDEQNVPAHTMCERGEHGIELVQADRSVEVSMFSGQRARYR